MVLWCFAKISGLGLVLVLVSQNQFKEVPSKPYLQALAKLVFWKMLVTSQAKGPAFSPSRLTACRAGLVSVKCMKLQVIGVIVTMIALSIEDDFLIPSFYVPGWPYFQLPSTSSMFLSVVFGYLCSHFIFNCSFHTFATLYLSVFVPLLKKSTFCK